MEEVEVDNTQRESTQADYFNTLNPSGMGYNHPELKFNAASDSYGSLNTSDPEFAAIYKEADGATKVQMLKANNNSDAIKISQRRDIFKESQKAIEQDGLLTQFTMGVPAALMSPSSVIPFGAVYKGAQIANTTSRLMRMTKVGGIGAVTGGTANAIDEGLFDLQGMPTNYLGSIGVGVFFGGGLGILGGALSGPRASDVAKSISPENDTFMKDYNQDPFVKMEMDESGVPKLQEVAPMEKSYLDRVPLIGKYLRSDVHTVLQGDNPVLRSLMLRVANATVSLKDANGNLMPTNKNGVDYKREVKGVHNNLTKELTTAHNEARDLGYIGDLDTFNKDTWAVYMEAMNAQKSAATKYAEEMNVDVVAKNKADKEAELAKVDEDLLYYKNEEGKTVPMTEELVGKIPDEQIVVKKDTKKNRTSLKEEIKERYAEELDIEMKKLMDEFYEQNPWEFKGDASITKSAESYRKYFQEMLKKSQEVGIKELQGMSSSRLYAPRTYNYKGIKSGKVSQDVLKGEIRMGLENDARNSGMTKEQLDEAVDGIVQKLNESAFDLNNLTDSFMVKDLPFSTHLKQKKLHLNETFMPNTIIDDFGDVTGAYHYKMSGRQATQFAFGTDQLHEIMDLARKESLSKGIIDDEVAITAFERSVSDLLGSLRMNQLADTPSWTFTRNLTSFNSARLGGGFGGNQFIELISSIMLNGTKAMMTGRIFKSLQNSKKLLYSQDGSQDEFANYLINSGFMEDTLHTSRINRYSDTEAGFNSGRLENGLNWANDKLMKYNGMRYFMGVMEDYTGAAIVTQLRAGNVDAKRLARWGLSTEDAKSLGASLKANTSKEGWDIGNLTLKERDSLQLAISRGIEEIVVQGDSIHLPAWMKAPGQFTKVLTQFMRFPMIAQETLTRRGVPEDGARMVGGIVSSIATYMGIKYLREQASVATGSVHEADMKYDYANYNDEDYTRVIREAVSYTAPLGFMTSIYNYGAIATGNNELGREWSSKNGMSALLGPSGGLGEDVIQLMRGAVEGEAFSERNLNRVKSMTPFMNLPLISEGGKYLIEEFGD